MERVLNQAFVTLATTDSYAIGAMVLASSLRQVGTRRQLAVMVTNGVSDTVKTTLSNYFDHVETVNLYDSNDTVNLQLLNRPELGVTFTKLHCWRLIQYYKAVFMDADTLVLSNIDDLFDREELSASRDIGWPDNFNSGVFVYRPSLTTYQALLQHAITTGSYDGGDQGLLNTFFNTWGFADMSRHLPFTYNCCSQTFYSYKPALKQFGEQVKVVHFIGSVKPWMDAPVTQSNAASGTPDFLYQWWSVFSRFVKAGLLNLEMKDVPLHKEALTSHVYAGSASCGTTSHVDPRDRQREWEAGKVDYTGKDRFENIMSKMTSTIGSSDIPSGGNVTLSDRTSPAKETSRSVTTTTPAKQ